MTPCTATLSLIKLTYRDDPVKLEAALSAWNWLPTLKTDKRCEAKEKEKLRKLRMERILAGEKVGIEREMK